MNDEVEVAQQLYFTEVLPWQSQQWDSLVARYDRLPHGLLFSGMQGIGKRPFVWRFVAWLLCDNRKISPQGACGECQSCLWLASGTHPDLRVLPSSSMPTSHEADLKGATKSGKANSKKTKKNSDALLKQEPKVSIKIDDIRELQPFISQGSTGRRVCVIDNADMMTIAAANALLKTLEEPRDGIHVLLVTDMPTKLLPTIKSRVQQVGIDHIKVDTVKEYLVKNIKSKDLAKFKDDTSLNLQIEQLLKMSNGAPLAALAMLTSDWYQYRVTWINVWLALRVGKRSSIAASDYWQKTLLLDSFIKLSEFMLMDFSRHSLGMTPLQQDLKLEKYASVSELDVEAIQRVMSIIEDIKQSLQQNVQDKMAYDRVMSALAVL